MAMNYFGQYPGVTIRFLEKFEAGEPNECWEWKASKWSTGYGAFSIGKGLRSAHRLSYRLFCGPIGESQVLHMCDNRGCVNPRHLMVGTHDDNMRHRRERNPESYRDNAPPPQVGEANGTAILTEAQVGEIRREYDEASTRYGLLLELTDRYEVKYSTIRDVVYRQSWKHVN